MDFKIHLWILQTAPLFLKLWAPTVQCRSDHPLALAQQAVCISNPHTPFLPLGSHPEAVDGEYDARRNTLQLMQVSLTANPSHCPLKQAFDSTCFCPAGKWLWQKFPVLSRDSVVFLKCRVAQCAGERKLMNQGQDVVIILMWGSDGM